MQEKAAISPLHLLPNSSASKQLIYLISYLIISKLDSNVRRMIP